MPNYQLLTSTEHKALRVQPAVDNEPHFAQIVTSEFASAATSCPVMFTKDPSTGQFFACAMLSLKPGEAALKDAVARGGFVPLSIQFNGFYISGQQIAIDRDNPRFSDVEGELLFTEADQPGDYLRRVQNALGRFHAGIEATNNLIRALVELRLVEQIDMTLNFDNGERLLINGLYTVTLDGLRSLDDATVLRLFRAGHLELAYIVAGSLKQFNVLAHLRNQRVKPGESKLA